jgi:septum formation protein
MALPVILLASNSPRRRELLSWTGWPYHIGSAAVDETPHLDEKPDRYVLRLAESKARTANFNINAGTIIITADTTVVYEDTIMGKPASPDDARDMLQKLRGRIHHVHTGLAVMLAGQDDLTMDLCTSTVTMRRYTDEEIEIYIASGDPLDKAGAYAIQHSGFHPVIDFKDCFANVVGLPLCHLKRKLKLLGFELLADIPSLCHHNMNYSCSIFREIV